MLATPNKLTPSLPLVLAGSTYRVHEEKNDVLHVFQDQGTIAAILWREN